MFLFSAEHLQNGGGERGKVRKKGNEEKRKDRKQASVILPLAGKSDNKTVNIKIWELLCSSFESYPLQSHKIIHN